METVLAATLIVFLLLFGAFTLSETYIDMQDTLQVAWQDMTERLSDQMQTRMSVVSAQSDSTGRVVELRLRNDGSQRLIDYDNWDVFIQYYESGSSGFYGIKRLVYTGAPVDDQLPVLTANTGLAVASLSSASLTGDMLALTDGDHPSTEQIYQLVSTPVAGEMARDGVALSVGSTFTQDDINSGLITYIQSSDAAEDSFTFTIADPAILALAGNQWSVTTIYAAGNTRESFEPGVWNPGEELTLRLVIDPPVAPGSVLQVTVGTGNGTTTASTFISQEPYTFAITITPRVDANAGAVVADGGMVTLSSAQLHATSEDVSPAELIYNFTNPIHGTFSPGNSFTQADIDAGVVTYTHDGSGQPDDNITFTITDGTRTTGVYTFPIAISG